MSGIGYPFLYEQDNNLFLPLMIGLSLCIVSLIGGIITVYMDKKSESFDAPQTIEENEEFTKQKTKFSISDIKKFNVLYWLLVGVIFLIWGSFYCFQNYG